MQPDTRTSKSEPATPPRTGFIWFPQETMILCLVSALDVVMTHRLLTRDDMQFVESNPFAVYFLNHWGIEGMAYFKAIMTLVACVIAQFVARAQPLLAKRLLNLATVIIVVVVIYSAWLHFANREVIEDQDARSRSALPVFIAEN